jgi:hypothetical protein
MERERVEKNLMYSKLEEQESMNSLFYYFYSPLYTFILWHLDTEISLLFKFSSKNRQICFQFIYTEPKEDPNPLAYEGLC